MKHLILSATVLTALMAVPALADNPRCDVPKADWQPWQALHDKLQGEGWKIRKIKQDNGCYEVYGVNAKGERQEVYFNPKTLQSVGSAED
jgi:hypothetical protein